MSATPQPPTRSEPILNKPLLIWDGDCGFCRRWAQRLERWTQGRIALAPSQTVGQRYPSIPQDLFAQTVVLVESDSQYYTGAEACLRSLKGVGWAEGLYSLYRKSALCARLMESGYRFVARNRSLFSRLGL